MKNAILFGILSVASLSAGCASPTAPTPHAAAAEPITTPANTRTSRVDPNTLEDSLLEGLTLDHDVWAPGVELCITKPRTYCSADGSACHEEQDYYTVVVPEHCPTEPIE